MQLIVDSKVTGTHANLTINMKRQEILDKQETRN